VDLNSFIYAFVSVVLVLLLCSMAGYAVRQEAVLRARPALLGVIAMLVVPGQVTQVPLVILIVQMDGAQHLLGLIVPTLANAQACS